MGLDEHAGLAGLVEKGVQLLLEQGFTMSVELLDTYKARYVKRTYSLSNYDLLPNELDMLQKEAGTLKAEVNRRTSVRDGYAAALSRMLAEDEGYQLGDEALQTMSKLLLKFYSGNLSAFEGSCGKVVEQLRKRPIEVKVIAKKGVCEDRLYEICQAAQGKYEKFSDLTGKITEALAKGSARPDWNLLSVLFDGIYIGEPEDLLNYRSSELDGVIYPTKGLGEKISQIKFLPRA